MNHYLVQVTCIGDTSGPNPFPTVCITGPLKGPSGLPINTLADVINILLSFLIPLAAIILFFVLVWGGYQFMFSQGNPEKIKSAKGKLTTGIVGFILLILAYFIATFVGTIFGL